ncbi:MAG: universal stress protein [Desulfurococcales archaeon]|nr:universal stress protein [Desulfurococcales archaeon]
MGADALERVLVGIDTSKASEVLGRYMIDLASTYDFELVFTYVVDESIVEHVAGGYDPNKLISELVEAARGMLENLVAEAEKRGARARYRIYDTPADPASALLLIAEEEGATEIAVAHKGHKLLKIIPLGSTTLSLISHTTKPVLVLKPEAVEGEIRISEAVGPKKLFSRVLVAVDNNITSDMVEYLRDLLAKVKEGVEEVYVVHVIEPGESEAEAKRVVDRVVQELSNAARSVSSILLEGHKPYKDILAAASQLGATLLVVGRRVWKRTVFGVLLGSTTKKIIESAEIPVLVYPLLAKEE